MQYPNLPTYFCQPVVFPSSFFRRVPVFILVILHIRWAPSKRLGFFLKSRPDAKFLNVWLRYDLHSVLSFRIHWRLLSLLWLELTALQNFPLNNHVLKFQIYNGYLVTFLDMDTLHRFGGIFENQFYLYLEGKLDWIFFRKGRNNILLLNASSLTEIWHIYSLVIE
jgi:hypothetical protein